MPHECRLVLVEGNASSDSPYYRQILSMPTHMYSRHLPGNPFLSVFSTGFLSPEIPGPPSRHCKTCRFEPTQLTHKTATATTQKSQQRPHDSRGLVRVLVKMCGIFRSQGLKKVVMPTLIRKVETDRTHLTRPKTKQQVPPESAFNIKRKEQNGTNV